MPRILRCFPLPVEEIIVGDIMIIRPGEKIAMGGISVNGESAIYQAAITGESMPVEKGPGKERVFFIYVPTYMEG